MSVDPDKLYIVHSKPKHDSHSDAIRRFEGDFECLSNTYKCLVSLRGDPEPYPSVEHALQASKTEDSELKGTIRQAKNAIEAKKLARVVKPTPEWRASSEKIVEALVRDKFRRNAKARGVLVGTGRVKLVYTNTHDDRFWGVCGGKGDNKLGKLLERVRADALAGKDTEAWCAMRFQLALPLDVLVEFAVAKGGQIVAEPSFEGKPVIRMGKLPENEVVMAHPSVSRSHALLVVDRKYGAFLIDLGASNGSFVDGRRLTPYVPEPITVGGEGLTFAKSKRTYRLTRAETNLREAKKGQLYASMDPMASASQPDPDSTIYMGNLDPSVTEDDLREFLGECGDIASIRIPQDKETGQMRGIAFVAFAKHSGVLHALTLHMDDLKGQSVKIRRADTPKPRDTAPGKKQQTRQDASSARPAPRAGQGSGVGGGGGGGVSDAAMRSAIEMATAAVIKAAAAAASKTNAAAAAAAAGGSAGSGANGGGQRAPKRQKMSDRFGEAPAAATETKRGSRWGDSGEQRGARDGYDVSATTAAAVGDGTATGNRHDEDDRRRRGEGGREGSGRGAGGGGFRDDGSEGERGDGSDRDHRDGGRGRGGRRADAGRLDGKGGDGADGRRRREGRRALEDDDEGRRHGGGSGERRTHGDRSGAGGGGGGGGGGRDGDGSRRGGHRGNEDPERSSASSRREKAVAGSGRRQGRDTSGGRRSRREDDETEGGVGGRDRADEDRREERMERNSGKGDGGSGGGGVSDDRKQGEGRHHRETSGESGRRRRGGGGEGGSSRKRGDGNGSRDGRRGEQRDRHDRRSTARSRSRSRSGSRSLRR